MGAINNAFNQAAGALAGSALAVKHAKESDFSKMNAADQTALTARNQSRETDAAANEAETEAYKDDGLIDQLNDAEMIEDKAKEAFEKATNRKNGSHVTKLKKLKDLIEAQKALDELKVKYKALEDLKARAEEQRAYADKATKMALDRKTKYTKHWGGNK